MNFLRWKLNFSLFFLYIHMHCFQCGGVRGAWILNPARSQSCGSGPIITGYEPEEKTGCDSSRKLDLNQLSLSNNGNCHEKNVINLILLYFFYILDQYQGAQDRLDPDLSYFLRSPCFLKPRHRLWLEQSAEKSYEFPWGAPLHQHFSSFYFLMSFTTQNICLSYIHRICISIILFCIIIYTENIHIYVYIWLQTIN